MPREVFLLVISRVVGIEFSIRPDVRVCVRVRGPPSKEEFCFVSWWKEGGWDKRDKGVENGDLGFGMIPGGAGFGLCLYSFLDERIAGCVRDGVPPRVERCLFMKERDICVFSKEG